MCEVKSLAHRMLKFAAGAGLAYIAFSRFHPGEKVYRKTVKAMAKSIEILDRFDNAKNSAKKTWAQIVDEAKEEINK